MSDLIEIYSKITKAIEGESASDALEAMQFVQHKLHKEQNSHLMSQGLALGAAQGNVLNLAGQLAKQRAYTESGNY